MGCNENLSQAVTIARTWSRPFPSGVPGELLRDDYTGVIFEWSMNDSRWIPILTTEKPFTLYVNWTLGNDTAVGDSGNPVKSISEAFRRLPPEIRHYVTIDVADNAGAPVTYDEQVILQNLTVYSGLGRVRVIGKNQAVATIAQNPGSSGTYRSWTIAPNPGWVANAFVGKYVLFTAGPHAGIAAWILANTNDTLILGYRPWPWEGAYGNSDAGEIREITTLVQQASVAFFYPTMIINSVRGEPYSSPAGFNYPLWIESIHLKGDGSLDYALNVQNGSDVAFNRCRIDDYVYSAIEKGGQFYLNESLGWTCKSNPGLSWFSSSPANNLMFSLISSGIIGGLVHSPWSGGTIQMQTSNIEPDPINPANTPRRLFAFGGPQGDAVQVGFNGGNRATPIYFTPGGFGDFELYSGCEIFGSIDSGILFAPKSLSGVHLRVDEGGAFLGTSQIRSNAQYAIDVSGPGRVSFYNATSGVNTVGGVRMRDGAVTGFFGTPGQEPTLSDGAANRIDFDDRTPKVWIPYTASATGLQTLCRYAYR